MFYQILIIMKKNVKKSQRNDLGTVFMPEQYGSAEDVCSLDNSVDALAFFKETLGGNGEVLLTQVRLTLLDMPMILMWT